MAVLLLCGTVQPAFAAGQGTELAEILPDSVVSTASGACGDQLSWEFDGESGILTISGTGAMWDKEDTVPWQAYTDQIRRVVLEPGVTTIGNAMFSGHNNLSAVTIPDTVTRIGSSAFSRCSSLEELVMPDSVTCLGSSAFFSSGLKKAELSDRIDTIRSRTFAQCDQLESVQLPALLENVGDAAFAYCSALQYVEIPEGVTGIEEDAFTNCKALERVDLPRSLNYINGYAFEDCTSLKSIVIPDGVSQILEWAFTYSGLERAYFLGDAPEIYGTDSRYRSLNYDTVVYHLEGKSGWMDGWYGDTDKWCGYDRYTWDSNYIYVEPLHKHDIVTNGAGPATAYFRLTDAMEEPLVGLTVGYSDGEKNYYARSDGNGIFAVPLGVEDGLYQFNFRVEGTDKELYRASFAVNRSTAPFSYAQKWTGSLGAALETSLGLSAGASVGAVEFEASAAKLSAKSGLNGSYAIEDSYENGSRTLALTYTFAESAGVQFKTGVEATLPRTEIKLLSASGGVSEVVQSSAGLRLENYDPDDANNALAIGAFTVQGILMGVNSLWAQRILDALEIGDHNQSAYTDQYILSAAASAGVMEVEGEKIALGGADAALTATSVQEQDFLAGTRTHRTEFTTEYGYGLLGGMGSLVPGSGGYLLGFSNSNSIGMSAVFGKWDVPQSLSYTLYDSGKQNIVWGEKTEERSTTLTYGEEELDAIEQADETAKSFLAQEKTLFAPTDLAQGMDTVLNGPFVGVLTRTRTQKEGGNINLPFSLGLGVGVGLELQGAFVEELSYEESAGIITEGTEYVVSRTDPLQWPANIRVKKLSEILSEPVNAVLSYVREQFSEVGGYLKDGVTNAYAAVEDKTSEWYVSICDAVGRDTASYAVLTVQNEHMPASNAAVAVTVGEPYTVGVYEDESRQKPVAEESLRQEPPTLTLAYTADMLESAGASDDAAVNLYRFDPEKNLYILVEASAQDRDNRTVSCPLTETGEYVLAVDSAAPLISDITLSDHTARPTLTALVSDLSGLGEFRFWIDDGVELVNEQTLERYYDPLTGSFTYAFEQPLAPGEHTAYFQAADQLGNRNLQPVSHAFTVDAAPPTVEQIVVPEETVSDPAQFQVTARVSDDNAVSQVILNVTVDNGGQYSVPMSLQDGAYYAAVPGISGTGTAQVTVVAVDEAGNRTEAGPREVTVDIPVQADGVSMLADWDDTGVEIRVVNSGRQSVGAWLAAAAYDERGTLLDVAGTYVGVEGMGEKTYRLDLECGNVIPASRKVFLLDHTNGYTPLAKEICDN